MGEFDTFFSHFFKYSDRVWHTGFQYIVGIYQKCTGIRVHSRISLECSVFIREAHDPAMGMSSKNRNIEHLTGKNIGSAGASADDCCSGTVDTCIRSLGPTKSKFHNSVASGCVADSGRLGGNKTLMVDNVQNRCFYKLSLHDRCDNLYQWFSWKHDGSLRDGIDIAGKMKVT